MLGLPASTEIHKLITRKRVYEHFGADMNAERRKRFEADIARMVLTNEVSPVSINLPAGEQVQSFFVLQVTLKGKEFDAQNIALLARLFGQRLVMMLEYEGRQRLALWQGRLYLTEWADAGAWTLPLTGLNLDQAWEHIVAQIAGIDREPGRDLDEQLAQAAQREKLQKEIARLEKQARAERQPKKKFELVQKIKAKQQEMEVTL
ncbi:MAG: DUF4391 domain-containing protein [Christensenellales bacterium]